MAEDRYFVQGETVRGEPRNYWVEDRTKGVMFGRTVTPATRDRRQADRWCEKLNAGMPYNSRASLSRHK